MIQPCKKCGKNSLTGLCAVCKHKARAQQLYKSPFGSVDTFQKRVYATKRGENK